MNTSRSNLRRGVPRTALALLVSASLLPAGPARAQGPTGPVGDRPADYFNDTRAPSAPVGDRPADYFKDTPAPSTTVGDRPADYFSDTTELPRTSPPGASAGQRASGLDWVSAGIGAAAAGVLIVVSLAGATAVSRLYVRTTRS